MTGCIWNREGSHTVGGPDGRRRLPPDFLSLGRMFRHLSCRNGGQKVLCGSHHRIMHSTLGVHA